MTVATILQDAKLVDAAQLAAMLDLHGQQINTLTREGILPKVERGRYSIIDAPRAYIRYLKAKIAEVKAANRDDTIDLDKARLYKAKADIAEMEAGLRARELVTLEHIEKVMGDRLSTMRQRLLTIPTRAAPLVAGEDVNTAFETMTNLIHEALEELSTNGLGDTSGPSRALGASRTSYTTAAKIDRLTVGRGKVRSC